MKNEGSLFPKPPSFASFELVRMQDDSKRACAIWFVINARSSTSCAIMQSLSAKKLDFLQGAPEFAGWPHAAVAARAETCR